LRPVARGCPCGRVGKGIAAFRVKITRPLNQTFEGRTGNHATAGRHSADEVLVNIAVTLLGEPRREYDARRKQDLQPGALC
jgi:hypothetical protein